MMFCSQLRKSLRPWILAKIAAKLSFVIKLTDHIGALYRKTMLFVSLDKVNVSNDTMHFHSAGICKKNIFFNRQKIFFVFAFLKDQTNTKIVMRFQTHH